VDLPALLAAWVLYPLVLVVLALGVGLLLERLAGHRLPGALLPPLGLAGILVLARAATDTHATAPLALPAILVCAVAGLALGRTRLRGLRPDPWLIAAALGVFAVYAAPVVLSGAPTFAGYTALPDTSHQLSLAWMLPRYGPDFAAMPDGSLELSMSAYIDTQYPMATQAALGATAPLGLLDLAWLYQPFLTMTAVFGALALAALVAPWVRRRPLRAAVAFVAAQPALAVGYAMQGSVKEVAATWLVVTAVALVAVAHQARWSARALLPLGVVGAAALGAFGPGTAAYLGLLALAVGVLWGVRAVRQRTILGEARWLAAAAALFVVAALPVLTGIGRALEVSEDLVGKNEDLGNLAAPLRSTQAFGVWLIGDYRFQPLGTAWTATRVLVVLTALLALVGIAWCVRRRAWGPLLLAGVTGVASVYLLRRGTPYTDAKVLAILSPAVLLLAAVGAAGLTDWVRTRDRRVVLLAAAVPGAVLALGVLLSNALIYRDVSLAPYDRYAELLDLNARLDGKGPAINTEYDEFGKYFLRDAPGRTQPEWPHGYRQLGGGKSTLIDERRRPSMKTPADLDDFTLDYLESLPYLITRRSPVASRAPAGFELAERGAYYDLWRRADPGRSAAHVPLGLFALESSSVPSCQTIRAAARRAEQTGDELAYVERAPLPIAYPAKGQRSPSWTDYAAYPGAVVPAQAGRAIMRIEVPADGLYQPWLEGSFGRAMTVQIDGRTIGSVEDELNNPGGWLRLPSVRLTAGRHRIDLVQGGGTLKPGSGGRLGSLRHVGPLALQPFADQAQDVQTADPSDWRALCGKRLDWLEIDARSGSAG